MKMIEEEYKYNCEKCKYKTNTLRYLKKHKKTKKHKKNYKDEINKKSNNYIFNCEWCNYHSNNKFGFYQHKRTKKHKKKMKELEEKFNYNCQKCDFKTNDDTLFINHYQDNHIDLEKNYKQYYNNQQNITNTNNNSNNTINNTYHFHLNNDSKTFKLMLNSLDHQKFTKMLGITNNFKEFKKLSLWDEERISSNIITNIVDKSIENKSISDIKITDTDLKNNKIKLKTENDDYKSFNLNNLLSDLLTNNFKLIKDEHKERIKDIDYLSRIIFMNQLSNNNLSFKKGYKYDYNIILNDILDYSIESIELIKQNEKLSPEEISLLDLKKEVYNDIKRNVKRMKSEVQLKCEN